MRLLATPWFCAVLPLPIITLARIVNHFLSEDHREPINSFLGGIAGLTLGVCFLASIIVKHLRYRFGDPPALGRLQDRLVFSLLGVLAAVAINMFLF